MATVNRASGSGGRMLRPDGGTPEARWLASHALQATPSCSADWLVPRDFRAVIVAPHPDVEVLACGGLIAQLVGLGRAVCVVAVTDGDASHPRSSVWSRARLAQERPLESARALALLSETGDDDIAAAEPTADRPARSTVSVVRLGEADGALTHCRERLTDRLRELLTPQDVAFTTWRLDGHPDHEVTGHACAWAAARNGARLFEMPVWGWHWAQPDDGRLPWQRAHRLPLAPATVRRKCAAVRAFHSQLMPDPSTGAAPALTPTALARAARPFEIFFGD